jgi:hypothetical protein
MTQRVQSGGRIDRLRTEPADIEPHPKNMNLRTGSPEWIVAASNPLHEGKEQVPPRKKESFFLINGPSFSHALDGKGCFSLPNRWGPK